MTTYFTTPANDTASCNPFAGTRGQKGVTIWGPQTTPITLAANGGNSDRLYFTFTDPKCYDGNESYGKTVVCNVTYTISTSTLSANNDVGPIWFAINKDPTSSCSSGQPYTAEFASERWHSRISNDGTENHDITETIDISQSRYHDDPNNPDHTLPVLNEFGANWIRFTNCSNVQVTISGLKIVRIYQMQWLPTDQAGECTDQGTSYAEQPDFATRYDYPCNYEDCGGMSSNDFGEYDDHVKTISHGETVSWTWTNPQDTVSNYLDKKSCFFNFNNVVLNSLYNDNVNDDVKFSIRVNNSNSVNFYRTRVRYHHMAHSVDLATHPVLSASGGYNDQPGGTNTLYFTLDSSATYGLAFCDGCPDNCGMPNCCPESLDTGCNTSNCQGKGGKVNIYRVYQTKKVHLITVSYGSGGSIRPSTTGIIEGYDVNFTITPNVGYNIADVQVDNSSIGAVSSYTFYTVNTNHTISASFSYCGSCQGGCQTCDGTCYGCQAACQYFCVTCDACYGSCQGCQDPCEASCQGCDSYVPCQSCDSCMECYACNPCQGCQPCETCYSCASCYEDCYEACYEGCYGG